MLKVMLVSGESSGDVHGAELARSFYKLNPKTEIFGMGGSEMRAVGVETVVDSETAGGVMGVSEVFKNLNKLYAAYNKLLSCALERKPDLLILIDFPDFNFLLLKAIKKRIKINTIYYIAPQVWAWRKSRIKTMKKNVDLVASIFPFEERFYKENGLDAVYVGHPFMDRERIGGSKSELRTKFKLDPEAPVLAILPGSRKSEIEKLLVLMLDSYKELKKKYKNLEAIVPIANSFNFEELRSKINSVEPGIICVKAQASEVLSASDCALIASGTATLEACFQKTPFVSIYKVSPLTYRIGKLLVKGVRFFTIVNIIAQREVVPELLQDSASVKNIVKELDSLISDKTQREKKSLELAQVLEGFRVGSGILSKEGQSTNNNLKAPDRVIELACKLLKSSGGIS